MGNPSQPAVWYYQRSTMFNPVEEGPFPESDLKKLATLGKLTLDTPIMSPEKTKGQWIEARQIKTLALIINQKSVADDAQKEQLKAEKLAAKQRAKEEKEERKRQLSKPVQGEIQPAEPQGQMVPQQQASAQPVPPQVHQHIHAAPPQAQPQQNIHVAGPQIVIHQQRSNTAAILLQFFIPGLGYLVQGRVLAFFAYLLAELICIPLIFVFGLGIVLSIIVHLVSLYDVAVYNG